MIFVGQGVFKNASTRLVEELSKQLYDALCEIAGMLVTH